MCPGYEYLRSLRRILYFQYIHLDTLGRMIYLAADHLLAIEHRIYLAEVHTDVTSDITLYDTGHDILFLLIIFLEQHLALFLTDLLKDDILRILRRDTSKLLGLDIHAHDIAELVSWILHACICQADLLQIIFHDIYHPLFRINLELTGLRINIYYYIISLISSIMILACLQQ